MRRWIVLTSVIAMLAQAPGSIASDRAGPVRLGIVGLTHTHVHWIFESEKRRDEFEIVGIAEPNRELAERYSRQHGFDMDIVFDSMEAISRLTFADLLEREDVLREVPEEEAITACVRALGKPA